MLLLIFLFRSTPEQYFIYLHPHEHHYYCAHQALAIEEVYHDCSDHLEYLSVQEFSEPFANHFVLQELGAYFLFHSMFRMDERIILKKGRSPPFIA